MKNYIVAGGGRTGSHWVEQIVKVLDPNGSVDHTNDIQYLLDQSNAIQQQSILLVCWRRDIFAAIQSYFVAKQTNEWFAYVDRPIASFTIDVDQFKQKIDNTHRWQEMFNNLVRPQYNSIVDVWFEDLVSTHPETYIGNLLNLNGKSLNFNWDRNKNPRDYSKHVINYQELWEIYLQNQ